MDLTGHCKLKNRKHKVYVYFLITILAFDYVLFPLPILAKEDALGLKEYSLITLPVSAEITPEFVIATPVVDGQCFNDQCSATQGVNKIEKNTNNKEKINGAEVTPIVKKSNIQTEQSKSEGVDHGFHSMTAYTSEAAQTDSSPCITANGFNVCKHGIEDTVAANFLKFGTKVKIPELFGDRVFVVRDRMNRRYPDRVDVWMINKPDAMKFGVRHAKIVVLES